MSQETIGALRSAFQQFARGDFSAYANLPDETEVVTASEMPDAGTYRGEAARTWLNAWVESFDSLTLEGVDFTDAGDQVVVEFVQRGTPSGGNTPVELPSWAEFTLRDDLSTLRLELLLTRGEALEAAGLAE